MDGTVANKGHGKIEKQIRRIFEIVRLVVEMLYFS